MKGGWGEGGREGGIGSGGEGQLCTGIDQSNPKSGSVGSFQNLANLCGGGGPGEEGGGVKEEGKRTSCQSQTAVAVWTDWRTCLTLGSALVSTAFTRVVSPVESMVSSSRSRSSLSHDQVRKGRSTALIPRTHSTSTPLPRICWVYR